MSKYYFAVILSIILLFSSYKKDVQILTTQDGEISHYQLVVVKGVNTQLIHSVVEIIDELSDIFTWFNGDFGQTTENNFSFNFTLQ